MCVCVCIESYSGYCDITRWDGMPSLGQLIMLALTLSIKLSFLLLLSESKSTGEGNGNPLKYSCLENPRDGGAWWPVIYGVAKSWI